MLGPAVAPERVVDAIREHDPDLVAISYRLSPQAGANVLRHFQRLVQEAGLSRRRFVFGGTPPVCRIAERLPLFERAFDGTEGPEAVLAYFRGVPLEERQVSWPQTLPERIAFRTRSPSSAITTGSPPSRRPSRASGCWPSRRPWTSSPWGWTRTPRSTSSTPRRRTPSRTARAGCRCGRPSSSGRFMRPPARATTP